MSCLPWQFTDQLFHFRNATAGGTFCEYHVTLLCVQPRSLLFRGEFESACVLFRNFRNIRRWARSPRHFLVHDFRVSLEMTFSRFISCWFLARMTSETTSGVQDSNASLWRRGSGDQRRSCGVWAFHSSFYLLRECKARTLSALLHHEPLSFH